MSPVESMIKVELFGVARLKAGVESVELGDAPSLRDAYSLLSQKLPSLQPSVIEDGRLKPFYALAVNGAIVRAGSEIALCPGDVLMILSADAGG